MPGEIQHFLQANAIRMGGLACLGDRRVPQPMRPHLEPVFLTQPPHNPVKAHARKPFPFGGAVKTDENGPGSTPCTSSQSLSTALVVSGMANETAWAQLAHQQCRLKFTVPGTNPFPPVSPHCCVRKHPPRIVATARQVFVNGYCHDYDTSHSGG
jgi:hypothetical protein